MSAPIGLELFRAGFADYADQYALIGGTAMHLTLDSVGLPFRSTKDLDIVLIVEALSSEFALAFWRFVEAGAYATREKSASGKQCYRFTKPATAGYPAMLELFSRIPDGLHFEPGGQLVPIPFNDEAESLSAILLDQDYYQLIKDGVRSDGGLAWVDEQVLIPLKTRAWLDLRQRKAAGQEIDERNIRKHLNDVLRLSRVLAPVMRVRLPKGVHADLMSFVAQAKGERVDMMALGFPRQVTLEQVLGQIVQGFVLGD
jgi:hypothetical protein